MAELSLEEVLAAVGMEMPDLNIADYLTENPDRTKTLRLEFPQEVEVKEGSNAKRTDTIDSLHFRRPKAQEMDMLEGIGKTDSFKKIRAIAARLVGLDARQLEKMDVDDLTRIQKVTLDFFPQPKPKASPATGETSPAD